MLKCGAINTHDMSDGGRGISYNNNDMLVNYFSTIPISRYIFRLFNFRFSLQRSPY